MTQPTRIQIKAEPPTVALRVWEALGAYGRIAVVVGLVARLRGLLSLVGLAFAFFILFRFVLPGLLAQESPTLISLVGSAAIMFVVLYTTHGFSLRTSTALAASTSVAEFSGFSAGSALN